MQEQCESRRAQCAAGSGCSEVEELVGRRWRFAGPADTDIPEFHPSKLAPPESLGVTPLGQLFHRPRLFGALYEGSSYIFIYISYS